MKSGQKAIYYMTGDSLGQIKNSPYLEKLRAKGFEVLLMVDKIDAWVGTSLKAYEEKAFQSVTGAELDLNTDDEKKLEEEQLKVAGIRLKPVLETMQEVLKDQVSEVKLSHRLTESPVCLVSVDRGASAHMERLLTSMGQAIPKTKRVMEINPNHALYEKMLQVSKAQQEEWADILYQQSLLNEGSTLENPMQYSQKIAKLMLTAV
jgi:molecular chaperone HtpG